MDANTTFIPSSADLLNVVPRLVRKLGDIALAALPEHMDAVVGKLRDGGSVIAEATAGDVANMTASNATAAFAQGADTVAATAAAAANAAVEGAGWLSYVIGPFSFSLEGLRGFGGMFSYLGSRWALTTFTLSILLNRTQFYASSRQNLTLKWRTRFFLYSGPVLFLLLQLFHILEALRCQTSPDYPLFRYRNPNKRLAINFGGDGGFLYRLSSTLLFWKEDSDCCLAMDMALVGDNKMDVMGSFNILWPVFLSLCFSQFIETMACAVQGRQLMPETGMTLFEHSLSFAECESMISTALGLDFFGPRTSSSQTQSAASPEATSSPLLTKSMLLKRLNAPPEVLLICFISCLSHLSSATLAVIGKRDQYRLVNTAIWASCYMTAFIWSFIHVLNGPAEDMDDLGILRFPTVCIIGFIPHILILFGISVCAAVYALALLITAMSLPPGLAANPTIKERFRLAFHNLQANVQFSSSSSIKLNWSEDFYTTLLKIGFSVLTAASEAVYLNEGNRIHIHHMTWLEEKRLNELASRVESRRQLGNIPPELLGERVAGGLDFTDIATPSLQSGYARERRSKTAAKHANHDNGLGIAERRGRWLLTYAFARGIGVLLLQSCARLLIALLATVGIVRLPQWLARAANHQERPKNSATTRRQRAETPDFWLVSDDGTLSMPENGDIDVETEMRRRLRREASGVDPTAEELDADLYDWWKKGGWWGDLDKSGAYAAREIDDDTTSMVSMSTNASDVMSEDESGRRTPTQEDFMPISRESTPERTLGMADLARLLDPKSPQDREEAQMLSRHLQSDRPMTRSQYHRRVTREKVRLLSGSSDEQAANSSDLKTEAEEEAALEHFILERRAATGGNMAKGGSWDSGAEGMGSSGPQCVVCQSNPRVIMVWPCGCLSICDECRVGVATRNFDNCMTCRTTVTAYSRLYVP